jgi:DNA modification methylase
MRLVRDAEVDLVITSPPYFPDTVEKQLSQPRKEQTQFDSVAEQITRFALTLRPVFKELSRVLKPGGCLIIQTKDIRYGDFLIPLADVHREMAINSGFRLCTRMLWLSTPGSNSRLPGFIRSKRKGSFRAFDTEEFMVLSHPQGPTHGDKIVSIGEQEVKELIQPIWRMPSGSGKNAHRYGSPRKVVAKLIELFSDPGDLVLDPFAGHGTTLVEAKRLGRRSIGYEIDVDSIEQAERNLLAVNAGEGLSK